jgi:hypothetical protein
MSRYSMFIAGGALSLAVSGVAHAQSTTQSVDWSVTAVDQISVANASRTLTVNTAVAGSALTQATASSTYAITTNGSLRKITVELDSDMPAGVTLGATFAAPTGGASAGALVLTQAAKDAVTGITQLFESGKAISYTLDAAITAAIASGTRTVTLTIVQGT